MKFQCAQRGCTFDADSSPAKCPVCKNPMIGTGMPIGADGEVPWSEYTVGELQAYCESWEIDGWNSRTSKADLIVLLKAAEAE